MIDIETLDFAKQDGVVTVVTQDATSGVVLMVAAANREAVEHTIATGEMHYRSRRRGLWRKGETSGHVQRVVSLHRDCDGDVLLARVHQTGVACHGGSMSCFGDVPLDDALSAVDGVIARRAAESQPAQHSYTKRLLDDRNLRLKKLGEECSELVVALADDDDSRAVEEAADLLYHMLVALRANGLSLDDVRRVLAARRTDNMARATTIAG